MKHNSISLIALVLGAVCTLCSLYFTAEYFKTGNSMPGVYGAASACLGGLCLIISSITKRNA